MTRRDQQYLNIKSRDTFFNPLSLTNRVKNVDVLYACTYTGNNQPTCVSCLARNTGAVRLGPWDQKSFGFLVEVIHTKSRELEWYVFCCITGGCNLYQNNYS